MLKTISDEVIWVQSLLFSNFTVSGQSRRGEYAMHSKNSQDLLKETERATDCCAVVFLMYIFLQKPIESSQVIYESFCYL